MKCDRNGKAINVAKVIKDAIKMKRRKLTGCRFGYISPIVFKFPFNVGGLILT